MIADLFARYHGGYVLAGLAVGVAVAAMPHRRRTRVPVAVLAALLPVAIWARGDWIGIGVAGVAAAVALSMPETPDPLGRWIHVVGLLSLGGVWAGVPDTEPAVILAAAVLAAAGVELLARHGKRADRVAYLASVVVAAWLGSAGAVSLVAGLGCVGVLAWPVRMRPLPTLAAHTLAVAVSSRVVSHQPWPRALVVAGGVVAVLGAVVVLTRERAAR